MVTGIDLIQEILGEPVRGIILSEIMAYCPRE
jgi:hypothetical protein